MGATTAPWALSTQASGNFRPPSRAASRSLSRPASARYSHKSTSLRTSSPPGASKRFLTSLYRPGELHGDADVAGGWPRESFTARTRTHTPVRGAQLLGLRGGACSEVETLHKSAPRALELLDQALDDGQW